MYHLERDVMNDDNVYKIFISDEDRYYYTSNYGKISDSEIFGYEVDEQKMLRNRKELVLDNRLIWYGGVESHKKAAITWFIKIVLPRIKLAYPHIEFHLWGKGTEQFDDNSNAIFGHGFYDGDGMPSETSLYINPDIIGGGIKLKLMSLLESGMPVISSPFGFEGYPSSLIDGIYCSVIEDDKWADAIVDLLNRYV